MDRTGITPQIRDLAERLVTYEVEPVNRAPEDALSTCSVCEKLRRSLGRLAGSWGFSSLLARALTLAKREAPVLSAVSVNPDGSLEGLTGEALSANAVLVAHLLTLLITFIGESLLMRLLHEEWPNLPDSDPNAPKKESV